MSDFASQAEPPRPRWFRRWCLLLYVLVSLVSAWVAVSLLTGYKLTRRMQPPSPETLPKFLASAETFRLQTRDGEELGAWYLPNTSDRPTVLLLHGNGARRASLAALARTFHEQGYPVLLITFRAHGDSTGDYNDIGFSARHDVIAAVDWLEAKQPNPPIVIYGRSMGAAAAVYAAKDLGNRVDGYVLESVYQDLRTAVWNRLERVLPPGVPHVAFAGLLVSAPLFAPNLNESSPERAAAAIPQDVPVLLIAGGRDDRARPEEMQAVANAIGARAEVIVFDEGDHSRLREADPDRYDAALLSFVDGIKSGKRTEPRKGTKDSKGT